MADMANVLKHSEMLRHGSNQYEEKVDVPRGISIKSAKEVAKEAGGQTAGWRLENGGIRKKAVSR